MPSPLFFRNPLECKLFTSNIILYVVLIKRLHKPPWMKCDFLERLCYFLLDDEAFHETDLHSNPISIQELTDYCIVWM